MAFSTSIKRWFSRLYNALRLFGNIRHKRNIERADRVMRKIQEIHASSKDLQSCYARAFGYLRRIDPLVFEELILSCFERDGALITRNRRYSGDGGCDGQLRTQYGFGVLQCKRYKSAIDPKDVEYFKRVVCWHGATFGIFAHTGRTGPKSYEHIRTDRHIFLLSGQALIDLIVYEGASLRWLEQQINHQFRVRAARKESPQLELFPLKA